MSRRLPRTIISVQSRTVSRNEKPLSPGTVDQERRLRLVLGPTTDALAEAEVASATDDPDRDSVSKAQRGDREAFRTLVENHQQRVFGLVTRVLRCDRDSAADIAQDVFLRVWKGLARFDGRARFTTWLHKIVMNLCISEYRKARTMKRGKWTFSLDAPIAGTDDLRIDPPSPALQPGEAVDQKRFAEDVRSAIAELPDEFRDAVLLRDLQGLEYEQIAEVLSVPPGTVRSRIHRGRLILQRLLARYKP